MKESTENKTDRQENKNPERKLTKRQMATIGASIHLGRKLQRLYGPQIKYYFLAGDSCASIASELGIAEEFCHHDQKSAAAAVRKAVIGNRNRNFGKAYRGLVNRGEVKRINAERGITSSDKLPVMLDVNNIPEDETPFSRDDPTHRFDQNLLGERVEDVLETLRYPQGRVVRLYHGIGSGVDYTQVEIGRFLRVTRSRVGQIYLKALHKIQFPTISVKLEGFVDSNAHSLGPTRRNHSPDEVYANYSPEYEEIV